MRKPGKIQIVAGFLIIGVLLVWSLFPIYWNILTSVKTRSEIFSFTPKFLVKPDWSAYASALSPKSNSVYNEMKNSVIIAFGATFITLLISLMAAYSFSRMKFKISGALWILILATRLLPPISTIIPLFLLGSSMRLIDTHVFLICIDVALNTPFCIWLLKSFFDSVPFEIQEASVVDGCSTFQSVWYILMPLVAPGIATAATFVFVQVWNEFTFAYIFSVINSRTLPVLIAEAQGEDVFLWQDMAARTTLQMIPVLLLALYLQKHLVGGLTAGSVKG